MSASRNRTPGSASSSGSGHELESIARVVSEAVRDSMSSAMGLSTPGPESVGATSGESGEYSRKLSVSPIIL